MSRQVVVFGDSHVHAIKEAVEARGASGAAVPIEVKRLLKSKAIGSHGDTRRPLVERLKRAVQNLIRSGRPSFSGHQWIGDTSLDEFLPIARRLQKDDILVSVIGGNQYAVFSTIQHPVRFDFCLPEAAAPELNQDVELIPFRGLYDYFFTALQLGDGKTLEALRNSTRAKLVHLLAPPPKSDNSYIEQHHDTQFAAAGISNMGVSAPELRMKFWKLQNRAIDEICGKLGIQTIRPPEEAQDPDGFLLRPYYAGDATHANVRYGELVLQQLEREFGDGNPARAGIPAAA